MKKYVLGGVLLVLISYFALFSTIFQRIGDRSLTSKDRRMRALRSIGPAILNFRSRYQGHFPARAIRSKDGKPLLSWRIRILSDFDESDLLRQFKLDEPWDSPHNKKLIEKMPKVFDPVGDPTEGKTRFLAVAGPQAAFPAENLNPNEKWKSLIPDGESKTVMIVEVGPDKAVIWTKPVDLEYDEKDPIAALGDIDEDGFIVLYCDEHCAWVPRNIGPEKLKAMFTRNAGDWPVE